MPGCAPPEVAAILTDLAIRYAQEDHATAYATLATWRDAREAIRKLEARRMAVRGRERNRKPGPVLPP